MIIGWLLIFTVRVIVKEREILPSGKNIKPLIFNQSTESQKSNKYEVIDKDAKI